jgi:hypothetical protein
MYDTLKCSSYTKNLMRVTKRKLIAPNQEHIIRQSVSHTRASLHTYQNLAVPSGRINYYTQAQTARAKYIAPALLFVWATEGGKNESLELFCGGAAVLEHEHSVVFGVTFPVNCRDCMGSTANCVPQLIIPTKETKPELGIADLQPMSVWNPFAWY